jgi:hypothetical protein
MRGLPKIGVVAAGYVVAVAVAFAVVSVYVAATSGPDRQTYAAMYDFGDMLLWLAMFGVAALPATGAALFFLRPYSLFWRASSTGALVMAATAVVTLFACLAPGMFGSWSALAPLRVFLAPLLALLFLLSALFAPARPFQRTFAIATAIEAALFVSVFFTWFYVSRSP